MTKKISCWKPPNKTYKCECINFYFILNKKITDEIDIEIKTTEFAPPPEFEPNISNIGYGTIYQGDLKVGPLSFCNNKTIVNNKLYTRFTLGGLYSKFYEIKLNGSCNYNINLKYDETTDKIISDDKFLTIIN